MAKQSAFLRQISSNLYARDTLVRDHMRTLVLDIVTIALGKLGLTPEQIAQFRDIYIETEEEFVDEVRDDFYGNKDEHIVYAKERIDRAIKEVVPESMFVPFEKRYISGGVYGRNNLKR